MLIPKAEDQSRHQEHMKDLSGTRRQHGPIYPSHGVGKTMVQQQMFGITVSQDVHRSLIPAYPKDPERTSKNKSIIQV